MKLSLILSPLPSKWVAPRAGAWIEIKTVISDPPSKKVAPRAGAWIEIKTVISDPPSKKSLPVRERGLKFIDEAGTVWDSRVAPRAGAWIEIRKEKYEATEGSVAPRAGAWIEILFSACVGALVSRRSPCGSVD